MALTTIPNPPRFQGAGPQTPEEWQLFWRWLIKVFQGLQTNVTDVANVTSMLSALWAKPTDTDGVDNSADIAALQGQVSLLFARPEASADVDVQPAIDILNGEAAALFARPETDTDPAVVGGLDQLAGQLAVLLANPANEDASLPPVGPGAQAYIVGAKLTSGGNVGVITLDAQGRITAITQAS
jgi:hypothetical protein